MTAKNPNIELVSINSYIKFGQNLSICAQDRFHILYISSGCCRHSNYMYNIFFRNVVGSSLNVLILVEFIWFSTVPASY